MFGNKEKQVIKNISKSTWWSIKVISSLADDIEDKEEKEEEKIQFNLKIASAKVTKSKSEVSGDTSIQTKLHDGKFMMAISDGMGSRTKS